MQKYKKQMHQHKTVVQDAYTSIPTHKHTHLQVLRRKGRHAWFNRNITFGSMISFFWGTWEMRIICHRDQHSHFKKIIIINIECRSRGLTVWSSGRWYFRPGSILTRGLTGSSSGLVTSPTKLQFPKRTWSIQAKKKIIDIWFRGEDNKGLS